MSRVVRRRKAVQWYHRFMPFAITMALMVLPTANSGLHWLHDFAPHFMVIAVFYWALMGPAFMPKRLVVVMGLTYDLLHGGTLGKHALLLLLVWVGVQSQREHIIKQGFFIIWAIFILVLSVLMALVVALHSAQDHALPCIDVVTWYQWLLTVFLYPAMHRFYYTLQSLLSED